MVFMWWIHHSGNHRLCTVLILVVKMMAHLIFCREYRPTWGILRVCQVRRCFCLHSLVQKMVVTLWKTIDPESMGGQLFPDSLGFHKRLWFRLTIWFSCLSGGAFRRFRQCLTFNGVSTASAARETVQTLQVGLHSIFSGGTEHSRFPSHLRCRLERFRSRCWSGTCNFKTVMFGCCNRVDLLVVDMIGDTCSDFEIPNHWTSDEQMCYLCWHNWQWVNSVWANWVNIKELYAWSTTS